MEKRPPLHLVVVAIEKGAFGSSSTKVANFTYIDNEVYLCLKEYVCELLRILFFSGRQMKIFNANSNVNKIRLIFKKLNELK